MIEDDDLEAVADFGYEHLTIDVDDEGIALVTVDRPKALNALNADVLDELRDAVVELAQAPEVFVLIITGAGDKAFVAGADIAEMAEYGPLEARDFSHLGQDTFATIESCPKPVIAAVNGFALGGGLELAMACHLRVASDNAKLGLPEVTLGLVPGFGGTQRLTRLCGPGVAREWILTGDAYPADEALRVGLVNRVVAQKDLLATARELAQKIAARGPLAVQTALELIRTGLEVGQSQGEAAEADNFGLIFATEDMREGTQAFLDKRKPDFQGR